MDIYILRHGKAEERLSGIKSDAKRKLTISGKNEIEEIAKGMNNFGIFFDYVVSSPLVRAIETSNIVAKHLWKKKKKITIWDELKPESDVLGVHKKLAALPPNAKILLVGHEPHLTNLISSIISNDSDIAINLKKGGFACIRGNAANSRIVGSLRSLLTPKQLKLCK